MKLSLTWLKDYLDLKLSTDELVQRLTMAGLEVEAVHHAGGDTILDLEITPNRPDCLSILGLAREISAITAKNLKLPKIKNYKSTAGAKKISIAIEDKAGCGRYIGTLIPNVTIADCPEPMAQRLSALGLRPINNAVDITNFVLMETGQPLHVFDYDKLEGGKIVVRRAKAGESIVTLDGVERKLDPSILVIADTRKPVAIAGIMGGQGTEITVSTKNILLESAHFDMGLVRRACRSLGLKSDSSYRFERGVDLEGILTAANRAAGLIEELCQGKVEARTDVNKIKTQKRQALTVSVAEIEHLLGSRVSAAQVKGALSRLGLKVSAAAKGALKLTPPSFRGDLKQNVDIVEEVARTIGYDRLEVSFPRIKAHNIPVDVRPRQVKSIAAEVLTAHGYCETITYSLTNQKDLDRSGLTGLPVAALHNALSQEHNILRPSLLPSLLSVALTNINRGQKDLRLFEIGKRYFIDGERVTLGILATGRRAGDWRTNSREAVDFFDVKGILQQIVSSLGLSVTFETGASAGLDPASSAQVKLNGVAIGALGRIQSKVLSQWDIKAGEVYCAEVDLEAVFAQNKKALKYESVPEFPAISRDVSIAVKKDIAYGRIKELCLRMGGPMLKSMSLIEEYTGDKIQNGYRGLVFSLTYQSTEQTLREEDVNSIHYKILKALTSDYGAIQR